MSSVDKFNLNRDFENLYDEAIGMNLRQEIKKVKHRYSGNEFLASGGMKNIYITEDLLTNRNVAKAVLKDQNDEKTESFFHEARICASLEHPNIIPIYDMGYDENQTPYFTMKLICGTSLTEQIQLGKLTLNELLSDFLKICEGMAYAHSLGIIHRDLKADNIQISSYGEVLICDWGLAKRLNEYDDYSHEQSPQSSPVTLNGTIKGTPGFMSPEQARGEKDHINQQSDIYSLGAILYLILTGKAPLANLSSSASIGATADGLITCPHTLSKNLPTTLVSICQKSMAHNPQNRYKSTELLISDIEQYRQGFATSAEPPSLYGSVKLLIARNRRFAFTVVCFSLVISTLLIWFIISLGLSENNSRKSQKLAQSALKKFKEAEEIKHKLTKDAAPKILERANFALINYQYYKGLEICDFALDLDSSLSSAHRTKGYILLSLFRFTEALKSLKKGKLPKGHKVYTATKDCISHFGSRTDFQLNDFIWVIQKYKSLNMLQMINEQTYSPIMKNLTLEERHQYAVTVMKIQNPNLNDISFSNNKLVVNFKKLAIINGLYKTGITTLDLKNSPVQNMLVIRTLPLEKLVWPKSNTHTQQLKHIEECQTLKELHLPMGFKNLNNSPDFPSTVKVKFYP